MYVTRISRYIQLSVLSAVFGNCGRSRNVLPVDMEVYLYYLINGIIGVLIFANIAFSRQVLASVLLYLKFRLWGAMWYVTLIPNLMKIWILFQR
jgi:hypothetical protein